MSLQKRLMDDMKSAMREKEAGKVRLSVIRMARAAIKNMEIDRKREMTEDETLEVIVKEVKQRRDSLAEYEKAGRDDIVASLLAEIDVLMEYLPKQLSEDEIRQIVRDAVEKTGASSQKDMGKLMGVLMPQVKGKADGKLVNQIVRELLQ